MFHESKIPGVTPSGSPSPRWGGCSPKEVKGESRLLEKSPRPLPRPPQVYAACSLPVFFRSPPNERKADDKFCPRKRAFVANAFARARLVSHNRVRDVWCSLYCHLARADGLGVRQILVLGFKVEELFRLQPLRRAFEGKRKHTNTHTRTKKKNELQHYRKASRTTPRVPSSVLADEHELQSPTRIMSYKRNSN